LLLSYAILILSAANGIAILSSELQTFANARDVATWLKNNNLEKEFIAVSGRAEIRHASPVAR
jgi:hypothetical protein